MHSMDKTERRRSIRHSLKLHYNFTLNNDKYLGTTGNISLTGIFLQSISPDLSISFENHEIELQLKLDKKTFISQAKIVYISDSTIPLMRGVGIEFIKPDEGMRRLLKNFILRQSNYSTDFKTS